MKYEGNIPDHFGNSFWTNVKTRWNYNDNSTWIKLIGVTDREWNGTFTEIDGKFTIFTFFVNFLTFLEFSRQI